MDPILLGVIGILGMLVLAAFGVPVGFAVGIFGALGLWLTGGYTMMAGMMETLPYEFVNNYVYVVLPMFILMGAVASGAGIVTDIYNAAHHWTYAIRGGLLHATVLASAFFGAISGSSAVNAALFTRIALPEMDRHGYNKSLGSGAICAAGILAAFIPPSLSMVIYGFLTGESVGKLLMAGLIPGLVITAVFMGGVVVLMLIKPEYAPKSTTRFTIGERLSSLKDLWPMIVLIVLVLGGMYMGFFAPSAAGAVGAAGVIVLGLVKRTTGFKTITKSLRETMMMTSVISVVILGGLLFARFLTVSGFLSSLVDVIKEVGLSRTVFLGSIAILYILLGMVIDTLSIWLISVPVLHPIALSLGLDPMWFAVFILHLSGLGCITPPVGLNLFAVMAASEGRVTIGELYRGVIPFIYMEFVVLILLFVFPEMATWLPSRMIR